MNCRRIGLWILMTMMFLTLLGCGEPITVHFEVNGGDPIADVVLEGSSFSTDQIPTPTRTGYTFAGWFYESDFSSEFDLATILLGETTLYAKWTIKQPTITFNVLGGSAVEAIILNYNTDVSAPTPPTKTGSSFGGWYTDEACTTVYTFTTMPEADITLYAKWTINTYTITFTVDGDEFVIKTVNHGSELTDIPTVKPKTGSTGQWEETDFTNITENMTVEAIYTKNVYDIIFIGLEGKTIKTIQVEDGQPVPPETGPIEVGYTFLNWAGYNFTTHTPVTGPLTITAEYQIKMFKVFFYRVTGTLIGDSQDVQEGHAAIAPTNTEESGYNFTGWDIDFTNVTSDLSVTATATPISYTLTFNENDGSEVADIIADYKSDISAPDAPNRPGYVFAGWYQEDTLIKQYIFTAQSTMPLDGMTLYARWDKAQYTVTFNTDGGSDVDDRPMVFNAPFGSLPTPTKTGYNLEGWYMDGEVETKIESTTLYTATTNITLFAHWTINQYTITFEVNGGSNVSPITQDYDTNVSVLAEPSKTGYTFAGWYQDSDFLNAYVFTKMPASHTTVYVKWTPKQYTISFDSKEGAPVDSITQDFGSPVLKPSNPVKVGYTFDTWCSDLAATIAYTFTTMPAESITLYASWTIDQYTITFDVDGGTAVTAIKQNYNTAVSAPAAPTKTGYAFAGWYSDEGLTELYSFNTMPAANTTAYAMWTIKQFTITFDSNEGTPVGSITLDFGSTVNVPAVPTRVGYDFLVWCSDENLENTYTLLTMPGNDLTLYAKWIPDTDTKFAIEYYKKDLTGDGYSLLERNDMSGVTDSTYMITSPKAFTGYAFESGNPSNFLSGVIDAGGNLILKVYYTRNSYTITFNLDGGLGVDAINEPFETEILVPVDPTKTGYSFVNWYAEEELSTLYTFGTMPAGNITVYAKWTIKENTISFDVDGGSDVSPIIQNYNTSVIAPGDPTKKGYSFGGWYAEEALITSYTFSTMPAESMTVFAKWEPKTDTVYKVEHWQQNTIGEGYTLFATDSFTGTTDALAEALPRVYDYFTLDSENVNGISNGNIRPDGNLVLKLYYNRFVYTVELDYDDERLNTSFEVRHGATLSALSDPNRTGYTFLGWGDELGTEYTSTSIVEGSLYLLAGWNAHIFTITITHKYYASDGETLISTTTESPQSIAYGSTYVPTTSIPGNDLMSLEKNTILDTDGDYSFVVTANADLVISFKVRTISVTFIQNPTDKLIVGETKTVDYNTTLTTLVDLIAREGYTVVWDHTNFTNLMENMTVSAFYYENGVKIVTFMDSDTISAIISQEGEDNNIITTENLMWTPVKIGYCFDGWFAADGVTQWTIEEMLWDEVTTSLTLFAHWTPLEAFPQPTDVVVTSGTETVSWTQGKADDVYPSSYSIVVDGTLHTILASNCVVNETTGAILYTFANGILKKIGTHTVIVTALGDGIDQVSGPASNTATIVVEAIDSENPGQVTETKEYDYFTVEKTESTAIYTFYTDMIYNFNEGYTLTFLSGDDCATALNNKLTTKNNPGSFRFSVKNNNTNITKTYFGKVIPNINQFALDANLSKHNTATLAAYENKTLESYLVGSSNPFHFDLKILDNMGNRVDQTTCELIFTFSIWNEGTASYEELSTTLSNYVSVDAYQKFQFTQAAEGHKFTVTIKPKYQAKQMKITTLSFKFTVNDGYNVFTNSELQVAFADFNIENINIHSDIKCELRADQINSDGSPINGSFKFDGPNGEYSSGGEGAVYARLRDSATGSTDNLVVNGNYFTIDGSDLPYMKVTSDPTGEWQNVGFAESFVVVDSRIGIFNYVVDESKSIDDSSLEINNLTIIGNTVTPSVNYNLSEEEIVLAEALMSQNSGGYNGIVLKSGTNTFTNVNIGMTVMGFLNTALGTKSDGTTKNYMHADYVHIYESWASSFLGYAISGVKFTHCNIDSSGGAAIHIEDANPDSNDPEVFIDTATTVDNWISGQEAWFKVYAMTTTVTGMKSLIQYGVSKYGKSVIDTKPNTTTGLDTEMINFIIFQLPREGAYTFDGEGTRITGSQVGFNIPDANGTITEVHRAFNFMDCDDYSDPRASGDPLNFAFPVCSLSSFNAFISEIYGSGDPADKGAAYDLGFAIYTCEDPVIAPNYQALAAQNVGDVVAYEAFYNITRAQAIQAKVAILKAGGTENLPVRTAILNVVGTLPAQPQFLEVQATFDGKVEGGVATIILGLYEPEA